MTARREVRRRTIGLSSAGARPVRRCWYRRIFFDRRVCLGEETTKRAPTTYDTALVARAIATKYAYIIPAVRLPVCLFLHLSGFLRSSLVRRFASLDSRPSACLSRRTAPIRSVPFRAFFSIYILFVRGVCHRVYPRVCAAAI